MPDADDHGQPVGEMPDLTPWTNCIECKQGYARHVLNMEGVCPRCRVSKMECRPNPALPENTARNGPWMDRVDRH